MTEGGGVDLPPLTAERAAYMASLALGHVQREYPHKVDHVMCGPEAVYSPRAMHPVFYGSFDWHSCVHGYWLLARVRRMFPQLPETRRIGELFDSQLTAAKVSAEAAYLDSPGNAAFERPYGWAWLLMLAAELARDETSEARQWCVTLGPLRESVRRRFVEYLGKLRYPIRSGVHSNTAFAMALAAEFAEVCEDGRLRECLAQRAECWFGGDADAPAWEPGGDDFLSPTLMEAEAMRRILSRVRFAEWMASFLPSLSSGEPATLFEPALVGDRADGKLGHLDGLNLSRAWCLRLLAGALEAGDARRGVMLGAASRHFDAAWEHLADTYAGEHWLASFAMLALTAA